MTSKKKERRLALDIEKEGKVKIIDSASILRLIKQVIAGRIDGAYMNPAVCDYVLRTEMKMEGALVFDSDLPNVEGSYLLSTIKHPEILKELDAFIQENKEAIDQMKDKYKI